MDMKSLLMIAALVLAGYYVGRNYPLGLPLLG
jgi:hypothetical protein